MSMMRTMWLMGCVVTVGCASTQPKPDPAHHDHAHHHESAVAASAAAEGSASKGELKTAQELAPERVGQLDTCIVTGERFKVQPDTPTVMYQGKAYAFCCEGCAEEFVAAPEQFFTK